MYPLGIDVSHHQGLINWSSVAKAGVKFAFIKATEGSFFDDANYALNMIEAKKAGILAGPYHYYRLNASPLEQAKHFVDRVKSLPPGTLQPVIDLEEPATMDKFKRGQNHTTVLNGLDVMMDYIKEHLHRNVIVYTFPYYWKVTLKNPKGYASELALWIAHYDVREPALVGEWKTWTFWQFTSAGTVSGIKGKVDKNYFNGGINQLNKFAGL